MTRRTGFVWEERTMWHTWPAAAGIEPARGQVQPAERTRRLVTTAGELCGGRLLAFHEGGYSEFYTPYCGAATLDALRDRTSGVVDPAPAFVNRVWHALQPHQEQAVQAVVDGPLAKLLARSTC